MRNTAAVTRAKQESRSCLRVSDQPGEDGIRNRTLEMAFADGTRFK